MCVGSVLISRSLEYTFKMRSMPPTKQTKTGEVRIVDSTNFKVSTHIAAGLVILKPGGMRESHWHPNSSEWQYYIVGKGRMTVFMPGANARTMDFNANDVGYVPKVVEMLAAPEIQDVSLNNWLRQLPTEMVKAHLGFSDADIAKIPAEKLGVLA
jgi:oxalate decarboxylase